MRHGVQMGVEILIVCGKTPPAVARRTALLLNCFATAE